MIWLIIFILAAICCIGAVVMYILSVLNIASVNVMRSGVYALLYKILTLIGNILFWVGVGGTIVFEFIPWVIDHV